MKGKIKINTIDGWIDKGNGITTIYLNSGLAININSSDFITNYYEAMKNVSFDDEYVNIG